MQFLCAASSGQEDTTNVQLPPFKSEEAEACMGMISHKVTQLLTVAGPSPQLLGSHLRLSHSHVVTAVPGLVMTSHKGSPSRYFPQTSRCNTVFQALPDSMPNSREHFAWAKESSVLGSVSSLLSPAGLPSLCQSISPVRRPMAPWSIVSCFGECSNPQNKYKILCLPKEIRNNSFLCTVPGRQEAPEMLVGSIDGCPHKSE